METWPSFLPNPTQSYGIAPETMVAVNEFEAGPPVQRLRFDDQIDSVSVNWEFDNSQFAMFKEWYATKLGFGTKKFTMELPVGGVDGPQEYECEFRADKGYTVQYRAVNYWRVKAELFIEDVPFVSEATLDILLEEYPAMGTGFIMSVEKLDNFVESILPN